MSKLAFLYLIAGWMPVICSGVAPAADSALGKPNVLFIAVDDLNNWVGYLGGHSQAHTPNIDALAKEGVAFTHAYCPAPLCGPSRTALMYGILPHKSGSYGHSGVYTPKKLLPKDRLPLNLVLQKNGYYTAGCGKIFHYKEERGWDTYVSNFRGKKMKSKSLGSERPLSDWKFGPIDTENDADTSDGKLTDWAIDQLNREHDKPFFIALGLRKPHLPWHAPKKYFDLYDPAEIKLPLSPDDDLEDIPGTGRIFAHNVVGFFDTDDHKAIINVEGAWRNLVRAYLATSSFADANVGRLLDALKNSPHSKNTIVVLCGDHGWHLGEKQHWRKMSLWDQGTRTPFIIKMPGATGNGRQAESPVSLQDIFPTLVDLCGLEVEQQLDGNSLRQLMMNPKVAWDKPVLMSHGPGNFAVRKNHWRLIHYADGSEELYDLNKDPNEFSNLAVHTEYDEQRKRLRQHLPKSWRYIMGPGFKKFHQSFAKPTP